MVEIFTVVMDHDLWHAVVGLFSCSVKEIQLAGGEEKNVLFVSSGGLPVFFFFQVHKLEYLQDPHACMWCFFFQYTTSNIRKISTLGSFWSYFWRHTGKYICALTVWVLVDCGESQRAALCEYSSSYVVTRPWYRIRHCNGVLQ